MAMWAYESRNIEKQSFNLFCIFIVIVIVFGNSLFFDFVYDDRALLLGIDVYEEFKLKDILFSPGNGLEYLPVRDISYAVDYLLWGANPKGFHFTNIVLYILNALFVYLVTVKWTAVLSRGATNKVDVRPHMTAFYVTLLFAVHPIHSEVVSFISCRNVLLSGLFFFMSCYFFLKCMEHETGGKTRYYILSLVCFLLALFSKATSIILPFILLLIVISAKEFNRKTIPFLLPYFVMSGGAFFLFKHIAHTSNLISMMVFGAFSVMSKLAVSMQIPFFYLSKLVIPHNFSAEYSVAFSRSMGDIAVIASVLVLMAIMCVGILLRKKRPEILYCFLWFMLALLPVMNIFTTSTVVADRYVYLPSYAFFYLLTVLLFRTFSDDRRKWAVVLIAIVVTAWSFLAIERNFVWHTEKTLWEDTINVSPTSYKAYHNLGDIYFKAGNYDKAFNIFNRLKELDPSSIVADYYRGKQLFNISDYPGAIDVLDKALVKRESMEIRDLLGQSYESMGDTEKAMESYMKVLESKETDINGRRDLARDSLTRLRLTITPRLDSMRRDVRENALDLNARLKLAKFLGRTGLFDEAIEQYKELVRLHGDNHVFFYNMANIYMRTGKYADAVLYYEKSLAMNSVNATAYNNLGLAQGKLQKYDLAIKSFQNAIDADNNYSSAPFNLAVLYFHLGDRENALKYINYVREKFPDLRERVFPLASQLKK
jgi:tetratricopeptide (TPR) repeat protein